MKTPSTTERKHIDAAAGCWLLEAGTQGKIQ
jgi:hypothetical protein